MNKQFRTAEELMEYLKQQIVHYSNGEDLDEVHVNINSNNVVDKSNDLIDLSKIVVERENNNLLWNVSAERPITSHRKYIGKFIVIGKKIVRKVLRWYVSKTFELQSEFNGSVTRSINEISNVLLTLSAQMKHIEEKAEKQEKNKYENQFIEELQRKIKVLMGDLENLSHQLSETDTSLIDSVNELKESVVNINKEIDGLNNSINGLDVSISELRESVSGINVSMDELVISADNINNKITDTNNNLHENISKVEILQYQEVLHSQRLDQIYSLHEKLQEQIRMDNNFYNYRLRKLTKGLQSADINNSLFSSSNNPSTELPSNSANASDFDYLHFENKFRGSTEEIKNRQKVYLPYFLNASEVLDIGCGRGEFVELLIENNINVNGIDMNDDMVDFCQDRGLPVTKSDAITYLSTLEDGKLGGIFLGQVIEHMPFDQILSLVEMAYNKLKPGSHLIMETPNPLSLAIFYRTFYVDPTHVKPVHPLTIQYIVESAGFTKTELQYSSRVEPNWFLPKIESSENHITNINQFNEGVERINNLLYGYLDYAIIARK